MTSFGDICRRLPASRAVSGVRTTPILLRALRATPGNRRELIAMPRLPVGLAAVLLLLGATMLVTPLAARASAEADAECMECHDGEFDEPLNASWHVLHSARGRGSAAGCTDCHGASTEHLDDFENSPSVVFGAESATGLDEQNGACLGCHDGGSRSWWIGSTHHDEDLACAGCHGVHRSVNPVGTHEQQAETCFRCHGDVRAASKLRSRHPIEEGKTACVDCHNPHGSSTQALLTEPTLNDNCYRCHAEKRGPFLFEHAPVTEDCSHCHNPHGSVNDALLTARTPFLCQQCHSAAFHPSLPQTGAGLPSGSGSQYLLGKSCMNCHSQVHGSNHPSGARLTR